MAVFLGVLWEFHIIGLDHTQPPHPTPHRSTRPSYLPNCKFFGFFKAVNSRVYYWILLGVDPTQAQGSAEPGVTQLVKTDCAPSSHQRAAVPQAPSEGLRVHLPHHSSKSSSGLSLHGSCSCFYLLCAAALFYPESTVALKSPTASCVHNLLLPLLRRSGMIWPSWLGLNSPSSPLLCSLTTWDPCELPSVQDETFWWKLSNARIYGHSGVTGNHLNMVLVFSTLSLFSPFQKSLLPVLLGVEFFINSVCLF